MYELFFLLLLLVAPLEGELHAVPADRVAGPVAEWWMETDPCMAARALAERGACLEPEDCGAFEGWMRLFGEPRAEPLDPKTAAEPIRPRPFNCPAAQSLQASRGNPR